MTDRIWPDGWVFARRESADEIQPGDMFPVFIEPLGERICANCRDTAKHLYCYIVRKSGPLHAFHDSSGAMIDLPASLQSAPCPVCNLHERVLWLETNCGLLGLELEGKIALGLRLVDFKTRAGQEKAKEIIIRLLKEDPLKTWALFFGNNGTGKTHLLMAFVNALRVKNIWALYTTSETILRRLRNTYDERSIFATEEVQSYYEKATVLVIDEVDRVKWTDWAEEKLFSIIENRHNAGLATLFASNRTPPELDVLHRELKPILSRISSGWMVAMTGEDLRPQTELPWQNYTE